MSVFHQHVGSSITETNADAAASSDDDATFGLDDLLPVSVSSNTNTNAALKL